MDMCFRAPRVILPAAMPVDDPAARVDHPTAPLVVDAWDIYRVIDDARPIRHAPSQKARPPIYRDGAGHLWEIHLADGPGPHADAQEVRLRRRVAFACDRGTDFFGIVVPDDTRGFTVAVPGRAVRVWGRKPARAVAIAAVVGATWYGDVYMNEHAPLFYLLPHRASDDETIKS